MNTAFNTFWLQIRSLLGKVRNEEDYKSLLEFFFNNQTEEGLSYGELPDLGYSKLSKLENTGLIEVASEGIDNKMIVDLDFSDKKPCFSRDQISNRVSEYGTKLFDHANSKIEVMETIISILGSSDITFIKEFLKDLLSNLKTYNQIIEALQVRALFSASNGYGRLEWRPRKAKKFRLSKRYRN